MATSVETTTLDEAKWAEIRKEWMG